MNNHGVNNRRDLTTIDVELERAKEALEKAANRVSRALSEYTVVGRYGEELHPKAMHRPRTLDDVDADLERAIADLRGYCSRLPHGRVILTVARHEGCTYTHELEVERLTSEEVDWMMRERPNHGRGR